MNDVDRYAALRELPGAWPRMRFDDFTAKSAARVLDLPPAWLRKFCEEGLVEHREGNRLRYIPRREVFRLRDRDELQKTLHSAGLTCSRFATFSNVCRMPDTDETLTVRQFARRTGIGEHTIRGAIRSGELSASFPGERRTWARVQWSSFLAWMQARERPTQGDPHVAAAIARLLG